MSGQSPIGKSRTLTLPTGIKVRVKRPSIFTLVTTGAFPAELTATVWKIFRKQFDIDKMAEDPAALKAYSDTVEKLAPCVLAHGLKIVPGDEETKAQIDDEGFTIGTINTSDLDDVDKQALFMYGIGMQKADDEQEATVSDLEKFRPGTERVDDRPTREPVRSEAVESPGTPGDGSDSA